MKFFMSKETGERKVWWHFAQDKHRMWIHFGRNCFGLEIGRPQFRICFGVDDSGESTLNGSFCGFYWRLDHWEISKWLSKFRAKQAWSFSRSFAFYWYEGGLWLQLWGDDDCSSYKDPWWKRMHHLDFADLFLGKSEFSEQVLEKFENVIIPMPDGIYTAAMQFETFTWKRPLWFPRVKHYTNIELTGKAPTFPGKGENSWDCGDDSIWGMSVEGHSIPKAIGGYVQAVMEYRQKRSGLSSLTMEAHK